MSNISNVYKERSRLILKVQTDMKSVLKVQTDIEKYLHSRVILENWNIEKILILD